MIDAKVRRRRSYQSYDDRDMCTTSHNMMEVGGATSRMTKAHSATKNNFE